MQHTVASPQRRLIAKQQQLTNYVYDPSTPIDKVFQLAQEFSEYALFHGTPQPATTIMAIVYEIFRKCGKFRSALEKWNEKPPNQQTWLQFKLHFRQASKRLKEFSADTTGQAGYSNMVSEITTGVVNLLQNNENNTGTEEAQHFLQHMSAAVQQNQDILPQLVNTVNALNNNMSNMETKLQALNATRQPPAANNPPPFVPPFHPPPQYPFCQPVNQPGGWSPPPFMQQNNQGYTPQGNNQPQWNQQNPPAFQQQFQSQQGGAGRGYGGRRGNGGGRGGGGRNFRSAGRGGQQQQRHYCWTHGACSHPSAQCRNPAVGHQWTATFRNMMNGNNLGVW